uniref:THAP-type domain-containing protein n=1 Tax=Amphiprion percula TaxID=161767 RepID=A0A3P8RSL2_AMPPE
MLSHCAAYNCTLRHLFTSLSTFLTPYRFPKDDMLRRKWEVALRREGVLCSDHFKPDEFDRAGQICRLRPGVIPSVFNFLARLGRGGASLTRMQQLSFIEFRYFHENLHFYCYFIDDPLWPNAHLLFTQLVFVSK